MLYSSKSPDHSGVGIARFVDATTISIPLLKSSRRGGMFFLIMADCPPYEKNKFFLVNFTTSAQTVAPTNIGDDLGIFFI